MENYVILKRRRFRSNDISYDNNNITVKHSILLSPNKKFKLYNSLIKEESLSLDTKKVIADYYNLYDAYCPKYLKTILKNLKSKAFKRDNPEKIIDEFETILKSDFRIYTSIYQEDEIIKIITKFGSSILSMINKKDINLWYILNSDNKNTIKELIESIVKCINKRKLERIINAYIYKYGVLAPLLKKKADDTQDKVNNNQDRETIWNDFIYTSIMTYFIITLIETLYSKNLSIDVKRTELQSIISKLGIPDDQPINVNSTIKLLFSNMKKLQRKNIISFYQQTRLEVIRLYKDTKEVRKITNTIGYIIFYIESRYFEDYEYYKTEALISCLEEHEDYLISLKTKNAEKYTYEQLEKSYRRRLLKY